MGAYAVCLRFIMILVSFFTAIGSWVRFPITTAAPKVAVFFVVVSSVHSTSAKLRSYAKGTLLIANRWTIRPRYRIRIAGLTVWAQITGRSFVIREPGRLPRLIARARSRVIHTFPLTPGDVHNIYFTTSIHPLAIQARKWRPTRIVEHLIQYSTTPTQPLPILRFDLKSYRLVGPRLTQGYGIIGHGFCIALLEELGRWPEPGSFIAGKVFSWDDEAVSIAKIPTHFFTLPGVFETLEDEDKEVTVEWQELEEGLKRGPKVTVVPLDTFQSSLEDMIPLLDIPE